VLNIGPQELLLILVVALIVVGPRRLPELGRSLGKGLREIRKAQDEVRRTVQVGLDEEERPTFDDASRAPASLPEEVRSPERPPPVSGADVAAAAGAASAPEGSPVAEISKTLGRSLAEIRRAREEVQRSFRVQLDEPSAPPGRPKTRPPSAGDADAEPAERPGPAEGGADGSSGE
jgi:Tat protein translocase TatB subunit